MEGLDGWVRGLDAQMRHLNEQLDRRLRATQALIARVYEAPAQWSAQVSAMRCEEGFEQAWEGEPLITVRIATYNNAEILVERTLPSLLRQTYKNWEAIIVGDACSDDTGERLAAIGDPRISFENRPMRGPYPTDETARWYVAGIPGMNRALERARGAWIAALDHDDEWDDDHLEILLAEAKRTRAEIVYGKWRMVDVSNGKLIDHEFGDVFPPMEGAMAFQASLCHGGLARFHYDMNAYLADEPGDKNLTRRLWEAGVKFAFLDRAVVTYWFEPRSDWGRRWREDMIKAHGYVESETQHG
ncbi:MAG: glycosyltransferase [Solirubrobacterales bacterium]